MGIYGLIIPNNLGFAETFVTFLLGKVNLSTLFLLDRTDPNDPNVPVGPSEVWAFGGLGGVKPGLMRAR